jgi:arylsulfatase A-like enzyme
MTQSVQPATKTINEQVRTVDVLPTVLDIPNIKTEHNFRGRSLLPLIEGKTLPSVVSYREGVRATSRKICNKFSVRTNKFKLIKNVITHPTLSQPEYELYDLESDLDEKPI